MLKRLGVWAREFRIAFLLLAAIPLIIGSIVARDFYPAGFSWPYFFLALAAILLLHGGTIAFNDYFDYLFGTDVINRERTPFTGGTGLLVDGTLRPWQALAAGLLCFGLCIAIGLYIVATRSPIILAFGLVGVCLGAFYTAPPLKLAYRLLGEAAWFLSFPLTALGALFVQQPPFSAADLAAMQPAIAETVIVVLPLALIATAGFLVLEIPDYSADRQAAKLGLAVLAGQQSAIILFTVLGLLAYASLIGAVLCGALPAAGMAGLVTVPLFIWVWLGLRKNWMAPPKLTPYIVVGAGAIYLFGIAIAVALLLRP